MPRNAFFTADPTQVISFRTFWIALSSTTYGSDSLKEFLRLQQSFKSRYWVHTPTISFWHQLRDTRYISNTKEPRRTIRPELTEIDSRYPLCSGKGGPITLGDNFPYEPGDLVHFLGPRGCIGQGCILSKSGKEYRVAHSGTRISSLSKEYISPTLRTRKSFSLKAALCPKLNTIKCRDNLKVRFKLRTKRAKSHKK